jgi:hypothetical protein
MPTHRSLVRLSRFLEQNYRARRINCSFSFETVVDSLSRTERWQFTIQALRHRLTLARMYFRNARLQA